VVSLEPVNTDPVHAASAPVVPHTLPGPRQVARVVNLSDQRVRLPSAPAHLSLLPGSPVTRLGYPRPTPPRSLPQQPSVRRRLLTRHILRSRHSHRDPFPRSAPFESPPAAAPTRRSQGFCCSLVQQYHGSLRLLARHRLRFHLTAYTPSYPLRRAGPYETSRGNAENFPAAPPAHTLLCPDAPSISFAPLVQARHHLDRADRFANIGYGPAFRLKPFRPHLTVGALSCVPGGGDSESRGA
jgi:hypothetical protein